MILFCWLEVYQFDLNADQLACVYAYWISIQNIA